MDKAKYSKVTDFETSTEVLYNEFINLLNITTDPVFESDTDTIDGTYILYGMGGILIFFIVYTVCYSYCAYLKEALERQESEFRRFSGRFSRITYHRPQSNDARVNIEHVNEINLNINDRTKVKVTNGAAMASNSHVGDNTIFEPRPCSARPDQSERRYFPEDFMDLMYSNNTRTVDLGDRAESQSDECNDTEEKNIGWMSEPPLCFSSPQESKENIVSEENSTNLLNENDTEKQKYDNVMSLEKDINLTPSKNGRRSPVPERQSRSSPTSPDVIRRRFPLNEDTPRRPSSWQ